MARTVAASGAGDITVLLWVNGRYESSGGQPLPAAPVDWVARALGIATAARADEVPAFRAALRHARAAASPGFIALDVTFDPDEPIPPYSRAPRGDPRRRGSWDRMSAR